jgi:hypothetical protein
LRYEHPDPALSAAVTELLRSTSRVKPLERRLRAIEEKARELPAEQELCKKAAFHACLTLRKKAQENARKAAPKGGRVRR